MNNEILCKHIISKDLVTLTNFNVNKNNIEVIVLSEEYVDIWLGNRKNYFNNINIHTEEVIKKLKDIGLNIKITKTYKNIICNFVIYHSIEEVLSLFKLYNIL